MSAEAAVVTEEPELEPIEAILTAHNRDARGPDTRLGAKRESTQTEISLGIWQIALGRAMRRLFNSKANSQNVFRRASVILVSSGTFSEPWTCFSLWEQSS